MAGRAPILDSGACGHVCTDKARVNHLRPSHLSGLRGVSGRVTTISGVGNTAHLDDVLLVPASKHQLVSVGSLTDQTGACVVFSSTDARLRCETTGLNVCIAKRASDGLYRVTDARLSFDSAPGSPQLPRILAAAPCLGKLQISFQLLRERVNRLHRVFGHASAKKLRRVLKAHPKFGIAPGNVKLLSLCHACSLGRAKKARRPKISTTKASVFAERLSSDSSGRLRTRSLSGCRYACVIVDEFSAWCWAVPLKSLTEMHATVSHLLEVSLHQRNDRFVKHWRTDGGTENTNAQMADLFRTHGIEHELSCPGTSHQNGKAERHIGILFSTMRTLLSDARLPPSLWAEAMCCAVYVHNRTPGPSGPSPLNFATAARP